MIKVVIDRVMYKYGNFQNIFSSGNFQNVSFYRDHPTNFNLILKNLEVQNVDNYETFNGLCRQIFYVTQVHDYSEDHQSCYQESSYGEEFSRGFQVLK